MPLWKPRGDIFHFATDICTNRSASAHRGETLLKHLYFAASDRSVNANSFAVLINGGPRFTLKYRLSKVDLAEVEITTGSHY